MCFWFDRYCPPPPAPSQSSALVVYSASSEAASLTPSQPSSLDFSSPENELHASIITAELGLLTHRLPEQSSFPELDKLAREINANSGKALSHLRRMALYPISSIVLKLKAATPKGSTLKLTGEPLKTFKLLICEYKTATKNSLSGSADAKAENRWFTSRATREDSFFNEDKDGLFVEIALFKSKGTQTGVGQKAGWVAGKRGMLSDLINPREDTAASRVDMYPSFRIDIENGFIHFQLSEFSCV